MTDQLDRVRDIAHALRDEVRKVVLGQDQAIDLLMIALLCDGHILLEGVPGTAKTLLARGFAAALSLQFTRIQFTPDLMPGDVIGTNLFDFRTNTFSLNKGPIFTEILLGDEINRTPPKTQSALLQAMQERVVTIDGKNHDLGAGFMVIATQNPVESQGTYPLPEAQLDRFLFKHVLDYPSRDEEQAIVRLHGHRTGLPDPVSMGVKPIADVAAIVAVRETVSRLRLADSLIVYIVDLIRATREHPTIQYGASPRAAGMLATAARARAALAERDYVIPDDVKELALPALRHRIVLTAAAEIDGVSADEALSEIIDALPAPR